MAINNESYILALPYNNTTFCSTFIKLYLTLIKIEPNKDSISIKHNRGQLYKNPYIIIFL
jgi:hypothetical protein